MRVLRRVVVFTAVVGGAVLLAGCGGRSAVVKCGDTSYLSAQTAAPLRVPDDLSLPNQSKALAIPPGPAAAPTGTAADGTTCLALPPAFSPSAGTQPTS